MNVNQQDAGGSMEGLEGGDMGAVSETQAMLFLFFSAVADSTLEGGIQLCLSGLRNME